MRKILYILTIPFLILCLLTGCETLDRVSGIKVIEKDSKTYQINTFDYNNYEVLVTYESGKTETIALTPEMISDYDKLTFYKIGEHEIDVTYMRQSSKLKFKVDRLEFSDEIVFEGLETTYTGETVTVEVSGPIPGGTQITYPNGNEFTNAGIYECEAKLACEGYISKTLKTVVTINKAEYDLSNIKFEDTHFTYDGLNKKLEIEGELPPTLDVSYTIGGNVGNSAMLAGEYPVIAHFTNTSSNYKNAQDMTAKLFIDPAKYELSQLYMEDLEVDYDGENHKLELKSLDDIIPSDISIEYFYNDVKNNNNEGVSQAGTYKVKVVATTSNPNYKADRDIVATLTINTIKVNLDNVIFDSASFTYDGNIHSLSYSLAEGKTLPPYVEFDSYSESNSQINAGLYSVKAYFKSVNPNYEIEGYNVDGKKGVEADLLINRAKYLLDCVRLDSLIVKYDGNPHEITYTVLAQIPDFIDFDHYENNVQTEVGEYQVLAVFVCKNNNYDVDGVISATITIVE